MENPHIVRKTTDPVSAPPEAGIHWINTTTGKEYFSVGTSSLADWIDRAAGSASWGTISGTLSSQTDLQSALNAKQNKDTPSYVRSLSSGLISGGVVSINADTTKFDISAGTGQVIDNWTTPTAPTVIDVSWSAFTAVTTTYLATNSESWVGIDSTGAVVQYSADFTAEQRRDTIPLAKLAHNGNTIINNVVSQASVAASPLDQFRDLVTFCKFINNGVTPSANGANLSINISAGFLFSLGGNAFTSFKNPNIVTIASSSPKTFQYRTQTGVSSANTTSIDPANYDLAGTITAIAGSSNQATNQRIYQLPNGNVRIQYGQNVYSSLSAAVAGIATGSYVPYTNLTNSAILIGVLSVTKGCTALNNSSTAIFTPASKFGEVSASGGGTSTTTLQQAYDNSSTPELVTDSTRGALTVRRGSAADTDNVFEGKNNASTTTFSVDGNGKITTTGNTSTDYSGLEVFNVNTAGYARIATYNDSGNIMSMGSANSAAPAYGAITSNRNYLYSERDIVLMADKAAGKVIVPISPSGANTDTVFEVLNQSGTQVANITGEGDLYTRGVKNITDYRPHRVPLDLFDDFIGISVLNGYVSGGSLGFNAATGNTKRLGHLRFRVTTSGQYAGQQACLNDVYFGGGIFTYETCFQIPTLSDGTNNINVRLGYGDTASGADHVDGAYFEYDIGTSANWLLCTAAGGVRTKTVSSVAVTTSFVQLKLVVNATGTSVEYFVNDVSAGTVTTNIPTAPTGYVNQVIKTLGSTQRDHYMDFVRYRVEWTSGTRY